MISEINYFSFADSIESSHPVSVPVNHPSEISEIFDEISYKKGGSIIRMMANFLGVNVFNKGIEEYLKKHIYQNAQQVRGNSNFM
jgi:aminopeptidase 2